MRESIIYAALRSFFVAFFVVMGISIGIFVMALLISLITTNEVTPTDDFSPQVVANGDGSRKVLSKSSPVILKVNIAGTIGLESLTTEKMHELLVESREGVLKDDRVKAVLLYINSPGGTVTDADGIYRAIKTYKETYSLPVYAYVDGLCASGGMYVACAADKIISSKISLIGSVGVLLPTFLNFSKGMEQLGIDSLSITAGKYKDELNPLRPWKPGEEKPLEELTQYYYQEFVRIVTEARPNLPKEKLIQDYGAKMFPADIAKDYGYIDQSDGSYVEALKELAEKIGIEDNYYQVMEMNGNSWASMFTSKSPLRTGEIVHTFGYDDLNPKLMNKFLYLYKP